MLHGVWLRCASTAPKPALLPVQASLEEETAKEGARAARMLAAVMQQQQSADGAASSRSSAGAAVVATPGLQNQIGEYNCFLNVIIQCLWQCVAFRSGLLQLAPEQLKVG